MTGAKKIDGRTKVSHPEVAYNRPRRSGAYLEE
jgi:hypothetical protein